MKEIHSGSQWVIGSPDEFVNVLLEQSNEIKVEEAGPVL